MMRPEYAAVLLALAALAALAAVLEPRLDVVRRLRVNLLALAVLIALLVPLINAVKLGFGVEFLPGQ